jgi:hypothetical protein
MDRLRDLRRALRCQLIYLLLDRVGRFGSACRRRVGRIRFVDIGEFLGRLRRGHGALGRLRQQPVEHVADIGRDRLAHLGCCAIDLAEPTLELFEDTSQP